MDHYFLDIQYVLFKPIGTHVWPSNADKFFLEALNVDFFWESKKFTT